MNALLFLIYVHHISLKLREENEVGLVVWTGPGNALEILHFREFFSRKTVEIFVVWRYICIVFIVLCIQDDGRSNWRV